MPAATSAPGEEDSTDADRPGWEKTQPRIVRIEFEGNALFATESLKVLMSLKEGDRLDPVALDEDMETLFRFFDDVQPTQDAVPGGVVLRFFVSENPLVVEVNLYGVEEFEEEEIREMMSTRVGYPLFPYALATDSEDIVGAYRTRGYYFAQVPEPVITTLGGGGRRVDVTVVEGPEVEVQRIIFRGNAHVSRADLLDVMQTSEEGFLPFLSDAEFSMDVLLEDLVAIKRRVEAEGYLDAEVVLDDIRFSDNKERVVITIAITEHRPYVVGNIKVEIERIEPGEAGAPPAEDIAFFTEDRIRCWLGLQTGRCFSGLREEKGLERILEEYYQRSYIDAVVEPPIRRGRERENVVDLELKVVEGRKSRLRRLRFVGNEYTRDYVLRREARISPGRYVDRRELDRTVARLQRLGYFERVTLVIDEAECWTGERLKGWKDATYEIVEASTGQLNFGAAVSTDGGVGGSISFTKRNFDIAKWPSSLSEIGSRRSWTGAGQTLNIYFAIGTLESQFSVAFKEPHLFGTDLSFGASVYSRVGFWDEYDVDRLGYAVTLGYPIYYHPEDEVRINTGLTWVHELVDVNDIQTGAVPGAHLFQGEDELRSLRWRVAADTVNDLTDPTFITSTEFRAEVTGEFLGGDVDFYKLLGSHDSTIAVYRDADGQKHRLGLRLTGGFSQALGDTPEVPPYERFYLGGSTLRGFSFRGVGPHINGNPTGGEWVLSGQLEYEYPLVEDALGFVVFLDTGTVGTNIWEDDAFLMRLSTGFGLRIKLPMLGPTPLALDFGFPILYEDVDERSLVTFSAGKDF